MPLPSPSPSPPSFFEINIFKDSYARTILQQQFHYPSELHNRCAMYLLSLAM